VNTASKCGYTRQYEVGKLYKDNKDKLSLSEFQLITLDSRSPGTNEEIQEFCKARFGVTFLLQVKLT
jgi:glutathione peroxidase